MATYEIYQPIPSLSLEYVDAAYLQDQPTLQGKLPHIQNVIPNRIPLAIHSEAVDKVDSISDLIKPSNIHGRSYVWQIPALTTLTETTDFGEEIHHEQTTTYTDEYGNLFLDITTKGNNLTGPIAFMQSTTPSGFGFYGLQDSDSLLES